MEFKPTWLYIKQHNKTGLKYFGKTTKTDPTKYLGSGKYWLSHLAKHGKDVSTIWYSLFENKEKLVEYAISFSKENNISHSADWANLKFEDGLEGGFTGTPRSSETKEKLRIANLGKKQSEETKIKRKTSLNGKSPHSGIPHSDESKQKIRKARKLQEMKPHSIDTKLKMSLSWESRPIIRCIHCCLGSKNTSLMTRYHFDNCKKKCS